MAVANATDVSIDTSTIPEYVRPYLLSPIVDAVAEYMKQPGVAEKYEAWLAEKRRRKPPPKQKGCETNGKTVSRLRCIPRSL